MVRSRPSLARLPAPLEKVAGSAINSARRIALGHWYGIGGSDSGLAGLRGRRVWLRGGVMGRMRLSGGGISLDEGERSSV